MTKHMTNNSVLKRASLFENRRQEESSNDLTDESNEAGREMDHPFVESIKSSLASFKAQYQQQYPNSKLPFVEIHSLEETKQLNRSYQDRVEQLRSELKRYEFVTTFLGEIVSRNQHNHTPTDAKADASSSNKKEESDAIVSQEQYVTVITLNDSTYGEIHKHKLSPKSLDDATVNGGRKHDKPKNLNSQCSPSSSSISEPIYLNTLESKDKVAKKRPPTPPKKPKFSNASLKLKKMVNETPSESTPKSESLGLMQKQRKLQGPFHSIEESNNQPKLTKSNSDAKKTNDNKNLFLRTFSVDQSTTKQDEKQENSEDGNNIYDTVALDSDCDIDSSDDRITCLPDDDRITCLPDDDRITCLPDDDRITCHRDDDTTSSHEMLSRSSSTEEGLSNYVNIDYFLRKNSLGRSNSNLHTKLPKHCYGDDELDDNETNLSSMKSSDYDQFSSNENLLQSVSDSCTSTSTKSSAGVSSLKAQRVKPLETELASSYPPNLSTFTPSTHSNRSMFFSKESPCSQSDVSPHPDSSSESLKKASLDSTVGYYAYTDILDSLPSRDAKLVQSKREEREHDEQSLSHMKHNIVKSVLDSEAVYLDCLKTLVQYKKAFSTTTSLNENALLSEENLNTIFYRIPELYQLHQTFLNGMKQVESDYDKQPNGNKLCVGELFHTLVCNICIYSDFLRNYSNSLATASRCSANNAKFSELIKSIKIASMNGQFTNLTDLLHKPVARLQKNAMVLPELIQCTDPKNEEEFNNLTEALRMIQDFLHELNTVHSFRSVQDKFQRRLVKESFIVESGERRKLRHLFLFNDVIACARYKASSKQKFTFELKWFQMLNDIVLEQSCGGMASPSNYSLATTTSSSSHAPSNASTPPKEGGNISQTINQLKSRASSLRCDLMVEEKRKNRKNAEKLRKKISELESELMLYLPQLKFSFYPKNNSSKVYTFFLSSEYERTTWIETIKRMQLSVSLNSINCELASLHELERWFDSFKKTINPNLGSFLLRSNKDESLRFGDLYIRVKHFKGYHSNNNRHTNSFFVIEADSYGHFLRHAVTNVSPEMDSNMNQQLLVTLEGAQCLRVLYYEDMKRAQVVNSGHFNTDASEKTWILKAKSKIELTQSFLSREFVVRDIGFTNKLSLVLEVKFVSLQSLMERTPPKDIVGTFGMNIAQVCKREKSKVPHLIICCMQEVERRGLKEVGIYRVSGLSSEIQRLKKVFESSSKDAFWLVREIDIHAVTGLLKLYLRDLPESLFTNDLYTKYLEAKDLKSQEDKDRNMTSLLSQLKQPNQSTVLALIDHLVLVNHHEDCNKMSLHNLATVFGPTMLRTNSSSKHSNLSASNPAASASASNPNYSMIINSDLFTASTIDVMAQADILYFFLRRKHQGFSLVCTDREETCL